MRYLSTYGVVKKDRNKIALIGIAVAYALTMAMSVIMGASAGKPAACATIQDGTILYSTPLNKVIETGYDEWGYNYQARIFNGFYDNNTRPPVPVDSGDLLQMKWNDAWLSNKDCNNDQKLDRHAGFDTYKDSGAWLTNHASGNYDVWNVSGTYKVAFELGGSWVHDMTILDNNGVITGYGGYPAGASDYQYEWEIVSGLVNDNNISLTIEYTKGNDALSPPTTMHMTGTIAPNGTVNDGDWDDNYQGGNRVGTWSTVLGNAVENNCSWSDFLKIVAVPSDAVLEYDYWHSVDGTEIGLEIWGEFAIIQEISTDPCGQGVDLMNYQSDFRSGLGNW